MFETLETRSLFSVGLFDGGTLGALPGGGERVVDGGGPISVKQHAMSQPGRFRITQLEEHIAPSNGNFPPGQFPSGNPAQAPGQSNPNEVPASK